MVDEEYAIVSNKEFSKIKQELDRLKKNPLGSTQSGENLQSSVDNLSLSLGGMMNLFKEAADDMKIEERETQILSKRLDPLEEKVDMLIEQNQKIAKGIIAVADMVKEQLEEIKKAVSTRTSEPKKELPPLGGLNTNNNNNNTAPPMPGFAQRNAPPMPGMMPPNNPEPQPFMPQNNTPPMNGIPPPPPGFGRGNMNNPSEEKKGMFDGLMHK